MKELKHKRRKHSKEFELDDGQHKIKVQNNIHYDNDDAVGDGINDHKRVTDKKLNWSGSSWFYDYAVERVKIPKYLSNDNKFVFKSHSKIGAKLLFEDLVGVGTRIAGGLYGFDSVVFQDTPMAGVDMILTPSRAGVVKIYKIPTSMLPLDIKIPVSGDTELVQPKGRVWSDSEMQHEIIDVEIELKNGKKWIKKHIPAIDTTDQFIYTDAVLVVGTDTYTTGSFWGYSTGATWAIARNSLTSPIIAGSEFGGQVRNNAGLYSAGRGAISFDTSPIGAGTPTAAEVTMYQYNSGGGAQGIYLVNGLFASPTAILTTEFDHVTYFGRAGIAMDLTDALTPAIGGSAPGTKIAAFTDLTTINTSGSTIFGAVHVRDLDNSGPGVSTVTYAALFKGHDHLSAPSLEVTYTVPPTAPQSDKRTPWFDAMLTEAGSNANAWYGGSFDISPLNEYPEFIRRLFDNAINRTGDWLTPGSTTGAFDSIPEYYQNIFKKIG